MNRKAVFFDIDGTIWDGYCKIPESTVNAIRKLRENGHYAFICSGRGRANICDKKLFDIGFDGLIASCGTHVEIDDKIIYEKFIDDSLVKEIVEQVQIHKLPTVLEGPTKHWISDWGFKNDKYVDDLFKILGDNAVVLKEYSDDIRINKFSADILICSEYSTFKSKMEKYFDFIEHDIRTELLLKIAEDTDPYKILGLFEAVPKGMNKAVGMQKIMEYMSLERDDTFAIGDSPNDLDMIQYAGHGIAMGNAAQSVKDVAEFVTTHIYEDGIQNALQHYGLI